MIKGDPKWDMRRGIFLRQLYFYNAGWVACVLALIFGWLTAEEAIAIATLTGAVAVPSMTLTGAYMGIAEWGRAKGVINDPPSPPDIAVVPSVPVTAKTKSKSKGP